MEAVDDPLTGEKITPHPIPYSAIITDFLLGAFGKSVKAAIAELHPEAVATPMLGYAPFNTANFALCVSKPVRSTLADSVNRLFLDDCANVVARANRVLEESKGDAAEEIQRLGGEVCQGFPLDVGADLKCQLIDSNDDLVTVPGLWPFRELSSWS